MIKFPKFLNLNVSRLLASDKKKKKKAKSKIHMKGEDSKINKRAKTLAELSGLSFEECKSRILSHTTETRQWESDLLLNAHAKATQNLLETFKNDKLAQILAKFGGN